MDGFLISKNEAIMIGSNLQHVREKLGYLPPSLQELMNSLEEFLGEE